MAPAIPDRWIPYKACGNVIEGTRLICFKVPLRKNVQTSNPEIKEIWDIPALLNAIPKLGAVIDLTNTHRYYNPKELQAAGILHKKILMPGRIIPPGEIVEEFMKTVDEFLEKDDESLIGVHCTHGLNRTGFMVCQYMRDRLNVPAEDAIAKFEKARGYEIERENYKAHILGRKPPPPDLGPHTVLKSIDYKHGVEKTSDNRNYNGFTCIEENRNSETGGVGNSIYAGSPFSRQENAVSKPIHEDQGTETFRKWNSRFDNGSNHKGRDVGERMANTRSPLAKEYAVERDHGFNGRSGNGSMNRTSSNRDNFGNRIRKSRWDDDKSEDRNRSYNRSDTPWKSNRDESNWRSREPNSHWNGQSNERNWRSRESNEEQSRLSERSRPNNRDRRSESFDYAFDY